MPHVNATFNLSIHLVEYYRMAGLLETDIGEPMKCQEKSGAKKVLLSEACTCFVNEPFAMSLWPFSFEVAQKFLDNSLHTVVFPSCVFAEGAVCTETCPIILLLQVGNLHFAVQLRQGFAK